MKWSYNPRYKLIHYISIFLSKFPYVYRTNKNPTRRFPLLQLGFLSSTTIRIISFESTSRREIDFAIDRAIWTKSRNEYRDFIAIMKIQPVTPRETERGVSRSPSRFLSSPDAP